MRQLFLVFVLWLVDLPVLQAQLQESFTDGDFTQGPVWAGDKEYFQVNSAGQLQSQGPAVTGTTLHLSTVNHAALATQWEFYIRLGFATSAGNLAEVYLLSDVPDLKGALRGYFVRVGGTEDEVSLYRKDGSVVTKIIDGADKSIASSDNKFWVRVTRSATHDWTLELDVTGTKEHYEAQGSVQDARYAASSYAGVLFRYSQANAQRFYFDDFTIREMGATHLVSAVPEDPTTVTLTFSEPVQEAAAVNIANYRLNGDGVPVKADWQASAPQVVKLRFAQNFSTGTNQLEILRVLDADGNLTSNLTGAFSFSPTALPGDVRITEIYADVNPLQDLPAAEFIEIYNRSDKTFNLQGWRYSDATSAAGVMPEYLLRPGAYLILCAVADTALYRPFGAALGLPAFPSLNDSGDDVEIIDPKGNLIDVVRYSSGWYRDAEKRNGGWSLELIDVNSRCADASQWRASGHPKGGTPGQVNSVQQIDQVAPVLEQVVATSPNTLLLTFNEPLDSVEAAQVSHYSIAGGITVRQAKVLFPDLTQVELTLATPLRENERYTVTVQGQRDCAGNVGAAQQQTVVLPGTPQPGDVVINEILFNPRPGGVDFVEIVNKSGKYLNLQGWKLANRADGQVANTHETSLQQLLLAPGEYLVLTSSPVTLQSEYPQGHADRYLALPALPSYPDEAGSVVLLLPNGTIVEEVRYQSSQHFRLISDPEGISLERISLNGPSTEANFYSAATHVKATPGYENSQAREGILSDDRLTLQPRTFTPDGDGVDDALLLQFRLPQAGFTASVSIYDAQGRFIRKLSGNALLGAESMLQWDGLTEAGAKAAIGYYVVLVELFNLQGQKEVLKQTAVVGGRF
ncbi:lamin tail domain-containing protein [Rufibacter sediminis]|uniref:Lamin tail domain-containing protein n=1 Tax=Rufibacter sediminis TaxID=2762756 RepID=A0ABR6VXH7_9BACT|nr:lamin tail domain-containing protein [Rufibacter sediminis]MBC3541841.1 lamin tail domain-containing protein [Rufibacter sediminis]